MLDLKNPIFSNENKARSHLEKLRWPDGRYCPHCGETEKTSVVRGKRRGLFFCNSCAKQFTVTVGTLFERSHVPLTKWLAAFHLMASSKKGISAHQLHRMLGITYKTAWFMAHRIREAMRETNLGPMGGPDTPVQADETYFGNTASPKPLKKPRATPYTKGGRVGVGGKRAIVALVSGGKARTFHIAHADAQTVRSILVTNATREAELHTDESKIYIKVGKEFADHKTVVHAHGKYVRPSGESTNACENYFSVFKRGMKGIYQHCAEKHLHRYLAEFDYRYNNREITDAERASKAIGQIKGRRLTYRRVA